MQTVQPKKLQLAVTTMTALLKAKAIKRNKNCLRTRTIPLLWIQGNDRTTCAVVVV